MKILISEVRNIIDEHAWIILSINLYNKKGGENYLICKMSAFVKESAVGLSLCLVCSRSISRNINGRLRVHGPQNDRCPGSGRLPRVDGDISTSVPPNKCPLHSANDDNNPTTGWDVLKLLRTCRWKQLRRVPRAARSNLADLLSGIFSTIASEPRMFLPGSSFSWSSTVVSPFPNEEADSMRGPSRRGSTNGSATFGQTLWLLRGGGGGGGVTVRMAAVVRESNETSGPTRYSSG